MLRNAFRSLFVTDTLSSCFLLLVPLWTFSRCSLTSALTPSLLIAPPARGLPPWSAWYCAPPQGWSLLTRSQSCKAAPVGPLSLSPREEAGDLCTGEDEPLTSVWGQGLPALRSWPCRLCTRRSFLRGPSAAARVPQGGWERAWLTPPPPGSAMSKVSPALSCPPAAAGREPPSALGPALLCLSGPCCFPRAAPLPGRCGLTGRCVFGASSLSLR